MNTDEHGLRQSELTSKIIGVFFDVYNELGYGFLEAVYIEALSVALHHAGLNIQREMPLSVFFRKRLIGKFRADLVVEETVLVEAKACSRLQPVHEAQVLNYLRASVLEIGLLLNFGARPQLKRLLYDNALKSQHPKPAQGTHTSLIRVHPC
jgi:GxxExxY protein